MNASTTSTLGEVRITLRDDVVFRQQHHGGHSCYVIEDPATSQFHRIGVSEYAFISLLDGSRTIGDALSCTSSALERDALTLEDAAGICRWLVENGLAKTESSGESARLHEKSVEYSQRAIREAINPIVVKLPIFCPDRLLAWASSGLLWLTSPWMFVIWTFVVGFAGLQVLLHWDSLVFEPNSIVRQSNWLSLVACWLGLKLVHESAHAIFCRKFGGEVREAGVVLIALAPIFYVDVTSAWRFPSKWQRIAVSAAGMYVEVFVGAIATLVWIHSDPGELNQCALNIALLSAVTTILFNANPLMRFDGYYILSDLLEIPNLATQGQQYLSYLGRRYFYGVDLSSTVNHDIDGWIVRVYAVLARIWHGLITISIALIAATLFYGAGLALVMAALVFWIALPLFGQIRYFVLGTTTEEPNRVRAMGIAGSLAVLVFLLSYALPWPFSVRAPAIVEYAPSSTIHAGESGFVQRVLVKPGQVVRTNDLLAVLENVELETEVNKTKIALAASKTRMRMAGANDDVVGQQLEFESVQALQRRLDEGRERLQRLEIRAPIGGTMIDDRFDMMHGNYVREGQKFAVIGDEQKKKLVVSISQSDARWYQAQVGNDVHVKMRGTRENLSLQLAGVEPDASRRVQHASICAVHGGSVAVRPTRGEVKRGPREPEPGETGWEYVEPRLTGTIRVPQTVAETLKSGQLAMVKLKGSRGTLGEGFVRTVRRWWREKRRAVEEVRLQKRMF